MLISVQNAISVAIQERQVAFERMLPPDENPHANTDQSIHRLLEDSQVPEDIKVAAKSGWFYAASTVEQSNNGTEILNYNFKTAAGWILKVVRDTPRTVFSTDKYAPYEPPYTPDPQNIGFFLFRKNVVHIGIEECEPEYNINQLQLPNSITNVDFFTWVEPDLKNAGLEARILASQSPYIFDEETWHMNVNYNPSHRKVNFPADPDIALHMIDSKF